MQKSGRAGRLPEDVQNMGCDWKKYGIPEKTTGGYRYRHTEDGSALAVCQYS